LIKRATLLGGEDEVVRALARNVRGELVDEDGPTIRACYRVP
jgi:hypothetical protein